MGLFTGFGIKGVFLRFWSFLVVFGSLDTKAIRLQSVFSWRCRGKILL